MLIVNLIPSDAEDLVAAGDGTNPHVGIQKTMDINRNAKGKAAELKTVDATADPAGLESPTTQIIVEWMKYEPPAGLRHAPNVKSKIALQIITESIDIIKARIIEDAERRQAETRALERRREELASENNTGATVEGTPQRTAPVSHLPRPHSGTSAAPEDNFCEDSFPSQIPTRPKKRTLKSLFRTRHERGESSSTGSLQRFFKPLPQELSTYSARRSFVLDLIKKNAGGESSTSPASCMHVPEVECVICLDDFEPQDTVKGPCHSYCKPCFVLLVASACEHEQHWPPKCCLNVIPEHTILRYIDNNNLLSQYRVRAIEWNVPINDRFYCSDLSCGAFIRIGRIERVQGFATCSAGHKTCFHCRSPYHFPAACPHDHDWTKTAELAESEGWKRCYGCGVFVEHREACQHMTCRCGAEFCYVCGLRWRTCHCTMEQLTAAKDQAFARRRARLEKEAEEEAEMQEAIRQVEEFEREEALKAELLRREQARIAEERQRRELQERITREGQRRRAVTAKYEELREIFTRLASEQRTIVQKDHNTREHKIRQSGEKTVQSLRASNQEEWEHHESRIEAKIAKRRAEDSQELTARIMEERLIEKQYADQLGAFWAKRPNGTNQACAAIRSFKREMDKNFVAWKKFADDDFDQFTHAAREELAIRRELMVEAERRAEKKKRDDELEFAQRKHAELRWMREVFQERERMLNDMEVEEMDNGEDTDTWFAEPSLVDDSSDSEGNAEENFGYAAYVEYAAYRIPGAFP